MTREELAAGVAEVLGLAAWTPLRMDTIMRLADAYAASCAERALSARDGALAELAGVTLGADTP